MIQAPLFELASDWRPPERFMPIIQGQTIAVDTETRDPGLKSRGPGGIRKEGDIIGVSVATDDWSYYYPVAHPMGGNFDRSLVQQWLQDTVARAGKVVFANAPYDLEWLDCGLGVIVPRGTQLYDVQVTEPLLDEELPSYSLDSLSKRYGFKGKDDRLLKEAASMQGIDPKSDMWQLHPRYVGPYAEADAALTLAVHNKQMPEVVRQKLTDVHELESALIPVLWAMRRQGVRVNLEAAADLEFKLVEEESRLRGEAVKKFGHEIDEWSTHKLAAYCQENGIPTETTEKGNASLPSAFLAASASPFLQAVHGIREVNRLRKTFVRDWIFDNEVNGVVHPRWHQMANDDGGAKTGRMSASDPNPQQVPSKSKWAPEIRKLFIPEEGKKWLKLDYSQQEPRILTHFALRRDLPGSQAVADAYKNDHAMDIYQYLAKAAGIERKQSKTITLGRIYGMGTKKLATQLGITDEEAFRLVRGFDQSVPFVRMISDLALNKAEEFGSVRTILGRRRRFQLFEPARKGEFMPMREEQARKAWPNDRLRRAGTHKALNAIIQGSAADMTKTAMLSIWKTLHLAPYLQVHDELDYGVDHEGQANLISALATSALPLLVPVRAETSLGSSWA